jgi:hypothetical protein
MTDLVATWWLGISASALASVVVLTGNFNPLALAAIAGALCLLAGAALAIAWREKPALWMALIVLFATLSPVVLGLAHRMLGWFGADFAIAAGAVLLLLATALVANAATRRTPVWLLGASAGLLAVCCGIFGFEFT